MTPQEHYDEAERLATEARTVTDSLKDARMPVDEAAHLVSVLALSVSRGTLHAKLAEVGRLFGED